MKMIATPRRRGLAQWGAILAFPFVVASASASAQRPAFSSAPADAAAMKPIAGNAEAGRYKVAMCVGCHGIDGYRTAFPEVYRVPKLGGQNASYLAAALRQYRDGTRHYDTMRAIAVSLSEQDIADIAVYYSVQTSSSPNNYLK